MIKHYSLKSNYSFYSFADDFGYLIGEEKPVQIAGELYTKLLLNVDGMKSDSELIELFSPQFSEPKIFFALLQLEKSGFITSPNGTVNDLPMPVFDSVQLSATQIQLLKQDYSYKVISDNINYRAAMIDSIAGWGINNAKPAIYIRINDNLIDTTMEDFMVGETGNAIFFPVQFKQHELVAGSLITTSPSSPCWYCLEKQLNDNQPVETFIKNARIKNQNHGPVAELSKKQVEHFCRLSLVFLANEITRHKTNGNPQVSVFNMNTSEVSEHYVRKMPQCPYCGDSTVSSKSKLRPIQLHTVQKKLPAHGGYRIVSAEATWEKYKHLVSDKTGVICHIEPFKGKNHELRPVWRAGYFVKPQGLTKENKNIFIKLSFGKGCSTAQARTSALCEAIERYSSIYQGDEPVFNGSYNDFRNRDIIHPSTLLNFSETQYKNRNACSAGEPALEVPLQFDESISIQWTNAWSLTKNKNYLLPLSYCYSFTPDPDTCMCPFNPNGHAAGNSLEEAILQGFLELVERDAVAIWWYNRSVKSKIDIASFDDPYFIDVHNHYKKLGWDFWILDVTTDLNIPVAVCIGFSERSQGFIIGMGCHLDFRIAVQRAITEMHQVFNPTQQNNPLWTITTFENARFLFPGQSMPSVSATHYRVPDTEYIKDDIQYCCEILQSKNMDILIIETTRPDIQLPTVKVIVPSLRHFWRRLGPGRLYDVPVQMGWLDHPHQECELNPVAMKV